MDFDRPSGMGGSLHRYPGTSCLATISRSLRDKSHSPIEGLRVGILPECYLLLSAHITPEQVAERSHARDYSVLVPADIPAQCFFGRSFAPISTTHLQGFLYRSIGSCPESSQDRCSVRCQIRLLRDTERHPINIGLDSLEQVILESLSYTPDFRHRFSSGHGDEIIDNILAFVCNPFQDSSKKIGSRSIYCQTKESPSRISLWGRTRHIPEVRNKERTIGVAAIAASLRDSMSLSPWSNLQKPFDTLSRGWHPTDRVVGRRLLSHLDYPLAKRCP